MSKLPSPCRTIRRFILLLCNVALIGLFAFAMAQEAPPTPTPKPAAPAAPKPVKKPKPVDDPADAGLQDVSTMDMGATAKGSGAPFNKDWPPNNTLQADYGGSGTMFGGPLKGGRVDIRLIVPVDIKAIEVVPLDYHGTQQPKAVDIYIDGKEAMKDVQLPHNPGYPFRIALEAHGQNVGIVVTDEYPPEPPEKEGGKAANYGGWSRLRVISSTDVASMLKTVDNYAVTAEPANIAPTGGSSDTGEKVKVVGEPRESKGHPCTLWDAEDVAHYKKMLGESKELKEQFDGLRKSLDVRITQPVGVPEPVKDDKGQWKHLSDLQTIPGTTTTYGTMHNSLSLDVANLGLMYQLTGEAKYADFAKKIFLGYADADPNYGIGARPGFSHSPSRMCDQTLGDAIWMVPFARGYDFIHDYTGITPDERKHIEDDFLKLEAQQIIGNHSMLEASTNWSAIGTSAVLTIGYATEDQGLINTALYGIKGTADKPTGGLYDRHFSGKAIDSDGLWVEGAMGYQFMAMQALIMDAETLWHHNIDMYRYRDGALKRLFDSPLQFSYPDLTSPGLHDSHHGSILGTDSFLYEYGYRRYQDPAYVPILNQTGMHLDTHFQQFPISVLYDRDREAKETPVEWKSVNFFGVGYGILRTTTEAGTTSVLLEYGPAGSHSHPDKMTLDIYAFNDQLMMDPGSIWYEQPLYRRWYRTTFAHPTMTVDELDQMMVSGQQLTYGPADGMGIERGMTDKAYPGVTLDRSVFTTPNYVADIFGGFARLPRKMDMVYHIRGQFDSQLQLEPMTFPEPVENGYNELTNVRHATTDKAWTANITRGGNVARVVAAGGTETEVIVGDGHYGLETPPSIVERRKIAATVYGNAIDISGAKEPYVKAVAQEGGLEAGYGLLKVTTPKGVDLCFTSYRPGTYKAGGLESDALQAFALMDGAQAHSLYLAGGKSLKVGANVLERSEAGLAYLEKGDTGGYILANMSPSAAKVTAKVEALKGMEAFHLDSNEKRTGAAEVSKSADAVTVDLKPMAKVEFAPKGATSIFAYREGMLRKRQDAQEAEVAKARTDCEARTKVAEAAAKEKPAPANTVLVAGAVDMSAQGDGEVKFSDTKRGAIGRTINNWNDEGHWIEWTFDAPAEGYYNLSVCYCSELDQIEREIKVNGEVQEPFAPMNFPSTGGWAGSSDDWRIFTAENPVAKGPLLLKLKQGKNVVRLTNTNGRGINVNYVAITSPDVKITRDLLGSKAPPTPSTPIPGTTTVKKD
jgi:hypothetical protein